MQAFANPERFMRWSAWAFPLTGAIALALFAIGLPWALIFSPAADLHGETVRVIYVHVPASIFALTLYCFMGGASVISLIWRHVLADVAARAAAPVGAVLAGLSWLTGAFWGARAWGDWWAWGMDGRLISMLILFITYLGYLGVWAAVEDETRAARLAAILCVAGLVNIPIVHFSVEIWPSMHQRNSMNIDPSMGRPLLVMTGAYAFGIASLVLAGMRAGVYRRRAEAARQRRARAAA